MRIAALDYGTQRIGVAVANTEVGIAFPATVLPNDLEQVARWLQQEGVQRVVVGAPYMLWGARNAQLQAVEAFAEQLRQRLGDSCGAVRRAADHCRGRASPARRRDAAQTSARRSSTPSPPLSCWMLICVPRSASKASLSVIPIS
jgi:RNase H-fold protein (predicted Holliday junction resolvase)